MSSDRKLPGKSLAIGLVSKPGRYQTLEQRNQWTPFFEETISMSTAALNPYAAKAYRNEGLPELLETISASAHRILDVGCGAGDNARVLGSDKRELHGLTLSEAEARLAAPHFHKVTVANVETWQPNYPKAYFDAIVLSHVLEHLVDPLQTLRRLSPLLRTGGSIYVATPNVVYWRQRLQFLLGRFDYTDEGILDRTHLRFFTPHTVRKLVEDAGFQVTKEFAVGHFPLGPLRRLSPGVASALDRVLCRWLPGLFGFHLICVGQVEVKSGAGHGT